MGVPPSRLGTSKASLDLGGAHFKGAWNPAHGQLETLAGWLRTIKVVREVKWQQRGHDRRGTNIWTYRYSPEVKRLVRGENVNATSAGKVLPHERWELERLNVK